MPCHTGTHRQAEGAWGGVGISPCGSHGQGRVSTLRIVRCVCSVAQSCPTLCDSPGSSVHGILQARVLEWVANFLLQRIFLTQGSNLHLLCLLHCRWILYPLSHRGLASVKNFSRLQGIGLSQLSGTWPWGEQDKGILIDMNVRTSWESGALDWLACK